MLVLTGATVEVTNDGAVAVSNGAIYKTEKDIPLSFELDSQEENPLSNTFAQQDVYFATIARKVSFDFTTVLGKVGESTTITGGVLDMFKLSNLSMVEGTAVGGMKVFDFTPNSNKEGKGELTVKTVDRTVVIEKVSSSISISAERGGEFKLKFSVQGYVKSDTTGQTNTLADPVKPIASVLTTTDGINTGVTVDGNVVDPLSLDFGMNLSTQMPPVMKTDNQIVVIDGAKHTLNISAYLSSATFEEGYDSIVQGTEVAIGVKCEDTTDTVIWELVVPKAKVSNTPNRGDNSGAYSISKEYLCRPTTGNDNFTLKYYSSIAAA